MLGDNHGGEHGAMAGRMAACGRIRLATAVAAVLTASIVRWAPATVIAAPNPFTEIGVIVTPVDITAGVDGNIWWTATTPSSITQRTRIPQPVVGPRLPTPPDPPSEGDSPAVDHLTKESGVIGMIRPRDVVGIATQFPVYAPGTAPVAQVPVMGITSGPNGHLWFTAAAYAPVGEMAPDGTGTTELVDPRAGYVVDSDALNRSGIVTGPDGRLWFTAANAIDAVAQPDNSVEGVALPPQIDRSTGGVVTSTIATYTLSGTPEAITVGPDGNIWVTEGSADKIGRITVAGTVTEFALPRHGVHPQGITAGPDGALWFTESCGDRIGRMTVQGTLTAEYIVPYANPACQKGAGLSAMPWGIATGGDRNLWFTESCGHPNNFPSGGANCANPTVVRLTTEGEMVAYDLPGYLSAETKTALRCAPGSITRGSDGNVWYVRACPPTAASSSEPEDGGFIGRLDVHAVTAHDAAAHDAMTPHPSATGREAAPPQIGAAPCCRARLRSW